MMPKPDRLYEHRCSPAATTGVCRSRGGESCAFDGAMIVLQCIADAAHLVHGPIACLGNSWESRGTLSDKGLLHKTAFTTDLGELDIIYGSHEKLAKAICETAARSGAKAMFVYSTCVTGLTGEDIDSACRKAEADLGIKVIPVNAPGFVGPKNLGNRIAGEALLDYVIGTAEPASVTDTDINLVGEYNIAGDQQVVEPVLRRAGFRVLSHITGNAAFDEIGWAHRARLNVMVCSRAMINVAHGMKSRYGIPFVEVSFFGKTQMSKALREIATALDAQGADVTDRVEVLIDIEERRVEKKLRAYSHLRGKKAVLYTGGVKSWSIISALHDLGIEVVAVGTKKSTYEDEGKMRELLGPDAPLFEDMTPKRISSLMCDHGADILIAGGRNQYLAIKEGYAFVDVNQERHTAYAGYDGLVNLAQQISAAIDFYADRKPLKAAEVLHSKAVLSENPLRHSQSIGAAMAMQGIDNAATVLHGAQGCNFLGKVLLTKHFREPISMVSTKLFVEDVVMGSEERLKKTIEDLAAKSAPEIICVLSTGLSEVKGEDILMLLRDIQSDVSVIHVPTPDYSGGLEEGYAGVVEGLARMAVAGIKNRSRVNILAGSALTPADVNEIRRLLEDYGLTGIFLPDMSALDGSRDSFSGLASGGTRLSEIKSMGSSAMTIAIGESLQSAAKIIEENCGVPYTVLDTVTGLAASDGLHGLLMWLSGRPTPARYVRQRQGLIDGMRDAMTAYAGKKTALAQECEKAYMLAELIREMGAETSVAVIPTEGPSASGIKADKVVVGDYSDIVDEVDLLIAGSHGASTSKSIRASHLEFGFPVFERLGANSVLTAGYSGTLEMINRIGNALLEAR